MSTHELTSAPPRRRSIVSRLIAWSTPVMRPMAGRRLFPIWAVVEHEGRRSGRRYRTPVAARRTSRGFIVPLAFGEQADWTRNILAAGGGTIVWKGRRYPVAEAETIDIADAGSAFNGMQRAIMRRAGIERCLRVRYRG